MKIILAALFLSLSSALSVAQQLPDSARPHQQQQEAKEVVQQLPTSAPFFAAQLIDPDEKIVAMSAFRGKPLVVNFWARWCPPCRVEIPELNEFRKTHAGKIEVLGIGIEDDAAAVKAFARDFPIRYPVFLAGGADGTKLMRALGNASAGLPYTLFIDRHGRVIGQKLGLLRQHDLDAIAPRLLAR